ncbi:hypothetical protein MINT15_27390 [Saccharomonospora viridis]|uniref:Uncharacterized protein n=2 Tax=Saccharomonospora viridis TaxID=1852 RepID=C7MQA0_SACVD|nr:hypothetical protein Svir_13520 [Saccharomonospora viridis DSM 43017]KHF42537.1 hypothetical protein MINT15_27390 [Saccharomonospora viridis]
MIVIVATAEPPIPRTELDARKEALGRGGTTIVTENPNPRPSSGALETRSSNRPGRTFERLAAKRWLRSTSRSRRRNRGKGSGGRRASRHKLTEQSRLTHEPGTQAVGGFGELRSISDSRSVED